MLSKTILPDSFDAETLSLTRDQPDGDVERDMSGVVISTDVRCLLEFMYRVLPAIVFSRVLVAFVGCTKMGV